MVQPVELPSGWDQDVLLGAAYPSAAVPDACCDDESYDRMDTGSFLSAAPPARAGPRASMPPASMSAPSSIAGAQPSRAFWRARRPPADVQRGSGRCGGNALDDARDQVRDELRRMEKAAALNDFELREWRRPGNPAECIGSLPDRKRSLAFGLRGTERVGGRHRGRRPRQPNLGQGGPSAQGFR